MQAVKMQLPDDLREAVTDLARTALMVAITETRNNQQAPGYLKATEASKYLGVSRSTFYDWIKKHDIPTVEIDGVKRYSRQSLDDFMAKYEH